MLLAKIIVHTGGAARVIDQIVKAEAEPVAAVIRERVETITRHRYQHPPTGQRNAAPPRINVASELRELASLRDAGVLTHAEFEAQKARLLRH